METPTSVKDIRSLLGFANYYHWYVPHYASIAAPLIMLTKKDVLWHWGPLQRRAFEDLKSALCAAPLLIYPDPSLPYTVVSDAFADAGPRRRPATSSIYEPSIQTYQTAVLGI